MFNYQMKMFYVLFFICVFAAKQNKPNEYNVIPYTIIFASGSMIRDIQNLTLLDLIRTMATGN